MELEEMKHQAIIFIKFIIIIIIFAFNNIKNMNLSTFYSLKFQKLN